MSSRGQVIKSSLLLPSSVFALCLVTNCGSDSGSSSSNATDSNNSSETIKAILVDPYISGAIAYEDKNNDNIQGADEQSSAASNDSGEAIFSNELTPGSTIRLTATKGTHNGKAFQGELTRVIPTDATSSNIVVSPMTTLLANGWTSAQVVGVLVNAGLTGITEADLLLDPMSSFNLSDTSDTITDVKLEKLQATVSIYNFLRIIDGLIKSDVLKDFGGSGFTLTYDKFILHPDVPKLLANMVTQVKNGLSTDVITTINAQMVSFKSACPGAASITIGDIVRGSIAISDYVIGKVIQSCGIDSNGDGFPNCDYSPASVVYHSWSQYVGQSFYVIRTNTNSCTTQGVSMKFLPSVLKATTCSVVDETGNSSDVTCS